MSATWKLEEQRLKEMIDPSNVNQTHLYMAQLLLYPAEVQDQILEDISHLQYCTSEAIATIFCSYSAQKIK